MDKKEELVLGCFSFLVLLVISPIISGFVLSILWKWFMVSTFAIPLITIPQAIGISYVAKMATGTIYLKENVETKDKGMTEIILIGIGQSLISPFVLLGMGYIVTLFL